MDRPTEAPIRLADLSLYQSRIRRNVILASTISAAVSAFAYHKIPTDGFIELLKTPADRVIFTLQCNAVSIAMPLLMIAHVGNTRFSSRQINPLAKEDRDKVAIHVRVLTNTMEQFTLSFVAQLIASTYLEPSQMAIIPILNGLFVVGRILFWRGYLDKSSNHVNRSMGLPLTMFPSGLLIMYGVYKLAAKFIR